MRYRNAFLDAAAELQQARDLFEDMASPHEGWAVIREEVDELWDEVKKKPSIRDKAKMRAEAIQIAAMALRFAEDICEDRGEEHKGVQYDDC